MKVSKEAVGAMRETSGGDVEGTVGKGVGFLGGGPVPEVVARAQVGRKEDPKQKEDGGSEEVMIQDTKRRCLTQVTVKLEGERQGDAVSLHVGEWGLDKRGYLGEEKAFTIRRDVTRKIFHSVMYNRDLNKAQGGHRIAVFIDGRMGGR